ncbi:secretory pathway protein Sec39-domain-containing protein [Epithele typhae]|uniref:secretory pathway protein Sec39-domain-containing protein n=1 Tax=Epithele typhae TaxID=378194 RepID=UPI0020089693|nr:secretory pathway protein Sec39-domain-containing protein [Epithele typhae]KAH9944120.1 secretory pathway protein Sec39-domain-containing protein [Epithele typhae]
MRLAISVARPNLTSLGTCFGKFTKSGKFKLHITALDYLAQFAKYKVWIKPNGEMPFLYGNHVLKAHLGRITEDTPEHQGVVVFSMNDTPLGFGVTARSTVDTRKLDPTAIIVFHQAKWSMLARVSASTMSTATTSSTPDPATQWTSLADADLSVDDVAKLLKPIREDFWVAAACVDRVLDDSTVQQALLDLGIERTLEAAERVQDISGSSYSGEDERLVEGAGEQARHVALVSYFADEPADAQLCRIRAVLLERLDRLNTYVQIFREAPVEEDDKVDSIDEEWEDDPWVDEDAPPQPKPTKPGKAPIPLSEFLASDLVEVACSFASQEHFAALSILTSRHAPMLWPYRFTILDCIPEYALASDYQGLLPSYDPSSELETHPEYSPWRTEADYCEKPECARAVIESPSGSHPNPVTSSELSSWYLRRTEHVLHSTGMIDVALFLIQHAASQGLLALDEIGEDLSLIARLVYDAAQGKDGAAEDWSLARWRSMTPSDVVRAYLAHSTEQRVVQDIHKLVMPFLFVLEARAERTSQPDTTLVTRLLHEYILNAPLDMVAAIFEASKPTLPQAQRIINNDEDMARLALACLYGSDSLDQWPTMSRIFECLPAWTSAGDDEEDEDETDTTISSLGDFVAPSTTRPKATPSDLLLFFKPLPITSLSRALDVLDVHLESGEILSRWSVPAPLRWFLRSNSSIAEQRSWANRMARRANASNDALDTQEDWEWLLEDMLKLSGDGESGSRSAFCLLSRDDIIRIFFSGLLSTGSFDIAKKLLRSRKMDLSLDDRVIEDICLTCSQEFYDNATSGNYHFGDMKLAYDCLGVAASSDRIEEEKEFIEATSRLCSYNLMSRPGIPISPIEIRLTKDRLSLVSRVLSSNNDAYKHTEVILDLIRKLGFRDDIVAEVKTLAMLTETALQADDFPRAYATADTMVNTVVLLRGDRAPGAASAPSATPDPIAEASEVCWLTCFQLGRHPEVPDADKKLALLGRALEICPAERLPDVLAAWRALEDEDVDARRDALLERSRTRTRGRGRRRAGSTLTPAHAVASLATRLQSMQAHMPSPDAAAFAGKAFSRVAANIPFALGGRGRSYLSEDSERSRSGSRTRLDGAQVSEQASRVLQKGIGWLLGAEDE